jgi:hypothetical protein
MPALTRWNAEDSVPQWSELRRRRGREGTVTAWLAPADPR